MHKKLILVTVLVAVSLGLAGCNIFSWSSGSSSESLIDEGQRYMRDGDYAKAEEKFAEAKSEDPNSSEARYYHAKAVMHGSGFNALNLATEIEGTNFSTNEDMPFTGADWPDEKANRLFQAVNVVYTDLEPIYNGQTTGGLGKDDVDVDLGIIATIKGVLMFRDTDSNGLINDQDFDFEIEWKPGSEAFSIMNMRDFIVANQAPGRNTNPNLAQAPVPQLVIDLVNGIIDNIALVVAYAHDIIVAIGTGGLGYSVEDVEDFLDQVIATAHMYRVADGVDNDGNNGADEETVDAIDNDGDGIYDEDSNGTWF